MLDAALREGIALPYGCRNGTCRSCRGKVVDGEIVYRDGPPKALRDGETEAGWGLLCQAVPASDVEVEVEEIKAAAGIDIRTLPCRVVEKSQVAHDVVVTEAQAPPGRASAIPPGPVRGHPHA